MDRKIDPGYSNLLSKIKIRKANWNDLAALEWGGELSHFRRIFSQVYRHMVSGDALIWIVDLDGVGLIGQVFIQLLSHRPELADGSSKAYLYGFRVKPEYRNQGIGTHLLHYIEDDLVQRGFRTISLNVSQENSGARRLYESSGYRVTGPDPGEWSYLDEYGQVRNVREPAWRMQKNI
jgi:ribosomal protein S18 acetylase RimI-like enzyme